MCLGKRKKRAKIPNKTLQSAALTGGVSAEERGEKSTAEYDITALTESTRQRIKAFTGKTRQRTIHNRLLSGKTRQPDYPREKHANLHIRLPPGKTRQPILLPGKNTSPNYCSVRSADLTGGVGAEERGEDLKAAGKSTPTQQTTPVTNMPMYQTKPANPLALPAGLEPRSGARP